MLTGAVVLYNHRGNTLLRQSGCHLKIKHPKVAYAESDCVAIYLATMSHLERLRTKRSQKVKDLAAFKPELGPGWNCSACVYLCRAAVIARRCDKKAQEAHQTRVTI